MTRGERPDGPLLLCKNIIRQPTFKSSGYLCHDAYPKNSLSGIFLASMRERFAVGFKVPYQFGMEFRLVVTDYVRD